MFQSQLYGWSHTQEIAICTCVRRKIIASRNVGMGKLFCADVVRQQLSGSELFLIFANNHDDNRNSKSSSGRWYLRWW